MKTFANYVNKTLKFLWLYMKKIRKYEMDYYRAKEKLTSDSVLEVMDAPSAIAHERKIIQTYSTAAIFYNKLKDIAIKYKNGINVEQELRIFNEELNDAHLPIFEKTFIRLKTMKKNPANNILSGAMTGGAADIVNEYISTEETTINEEDTPTLLYGGLQYFHNTDSAEENDDYYVENEIDGDEGYTGDSMELAAEYKRKYDEEQKQKAEELVKQNAVQQAQQNIANKTNFQSSSANWIMPVNGKITSPYGWRIHPTLGTKKFHDGIDIGVNLNTPVKTVADGKVIKAEWYNGYGKYIEIDHGNNIISFYGHLNEYKVSKGQFVEQGQVIALSGNTAGIGTNGKIMTTGAHLHFGVHRNNDKVNPLDFIRNF